MPGIEIPEGGSNQLSRNERFLQSLDRTIESNLSNEQFGVEQLTESLNISRTQLFRRLQKLTGKNISQYIREYRLKKALELLKKDVASASEIAYQVGFSSPSYFNKCFHEFYGYTPGELIKNPQLQKEISAVGIHKNMKKNNKDPIPWTQKYIHRRSGRYLIYILIGIMFVFAAFIYFNKFYMSIPPKPQFDDKSIAVLPFRNDSPDSNNEYLCNGIMEDIITHLQNISVLSVKSRQSIEQYRDSKKDIITIGKELNVEYILEGSFRRVGDSIRVTAQLVNTKTGDHVWAKTYDGTFSTRIFEFQSNVARQVAILMNAIITPEEEKHIDSEPTKNIKAYALAKRGFELGGLYWRDLDTMHLYQAVNLFEKAIELDPKLQAAVYGKGHYYNTIEWITGGISIDSAMFYYDKVLEINPKHHRAYSAIGEVYLRKGNYELALKNFNKSLELQPYNAWTHLNIGLVYLRQKENEKAFEFFFKSISLDKEDSPEIYSRMGPEFTSVGCYGKAEEYLKKAVDLQEGCNTISNYINSLYMAGKYEEALHFVDSIKNYINCDDLFNKNLFQIHVALKNFEEAKKYLSNVHPYDVKKIILNAYLDKKMGKIDFAEEFYDREKDLIFNIDTLGHQPSSLLFALARINAIKGNKKAAIQYLLEYEKQFLSEREKRPRYDVIHAYIETHPIFEDLHEDPDFEAFIERARNKRREIEEIAIEAEERFLF